MIATRFSANSSVTAAPSTNELIDQSSFESPCIPNELYATYPQDLGGFGALKNSSPSLREGGLAAAGSLPIDHPADVEVPGLQWKP
jgi:hypothetical protein